MGEETDIKKMKGEWLQPRDSLHVIVFNHLISKIWIQLETLCIVSDLREALAKRGLSAEGLKAELVNRLQEQLDLEEFGGDALASEESKSAPISAVSAAAAKTNEAVTVITNSSKLEVSDDKIKPKVGNDEKKTKPKLSFPEKTGVEPTLKTDAVADPSTISELITAVQTTTDGPDSATSILNEQKELTFAEKKASRAARFNLPVVENVDTTKSSDKVSTTQQNKRKQTAQKPVSSNQDPDPKSVKTKKLKTQSSEQPILPVDEIDKRLKRADKFGTSGSTDTDALKAMKRAHRFPKNNEKDKKSKKTTETPAEPLLSKEEIEKRLKRAEKFNLPGSKEIDELKAMLRAHRFQMA